MKCDRAIEKALSRYAAIAPVAKEGMSRAEACEGWTEVREARARNVDGADVSMRTLRRWATAYHDEGFEGLQRKERGDKGQLRAMNAAVLDRAIALKEELPSRSVRQIIDIMTAEGTIEPGEVAEGNSKVRKRAAKSALAGRSQVRAVHSRQHRQTKKDLPDRIDR